MREIQNAIGRIIGHSEQTSPQVVYVITNTTPAPKAPTFAVGTGDKIIKVIGIVVLAILGLGVLGILAGIDSGEPHPLRSNNPGMVYTSCGWKAPVRDIDGRWMTPYDANGDGVINCKSDIEMGA